MYKNPLLEYKKIIIWIWYLAIIDVTEFCWVKTLYQDKVKGLLSNQQIDRGTHRSTEEIMYDTL